MATNPSLKQPVGPRQPNESEDVKIVQALLNQQSYATHITLVVDGHYGHNTDRAIIAFQRKVLVMKLPDGIIPMSGPVLQRLSEPHVAKHLKKKSAEHKSNLDGLVSPAQFQAAAKRLNCEVAVIQAVTLNESPRGPFDGQGRPNILFEHHLFKEFTGGVWDKTHPDISRSGTTNYGAYSAQYDRLAEAEALNDEAAKKSASWGAFQILGENFKTSGYNSVDEFVKGMQSGVPAQLDAFVSFIQNNAALLKAVQNKDWFSFALHYNGNIGSKKNPKVRDNYDKRLAAAYDQIVKQQPTLPGAPKAPLSPNAVPLPTPIKLP